MPLIVFDAREMPLATASSKLFALEEMISMTFATDIRTSFLCSPTARTEEEPQDQAQQRQQQDEKRPQQLLSVGRRALKDVDDGPDVADQDQQAQETVVTRVEHRSRPRRGR